MKIFNKSLLTLTNGLKSSTEKKFFGPNLLKNRLSIRVRNFAPLNEPLNICKNFFLLKERKKERMFIYPLRAK
jgi:hypothetical protein